jgi:hypothetical protein
MMMDSLHGAPAADNPKKPLVANITRNSLADCLLSGILPPLTVLRMYTRIWDMDTYGGRA